MSPSPLFLRTQQQAMASPSDTLKRESSSPADPERIFITTLWPHAPDFTPGSSLTTQDRLLDTAAKFREEHERAIEFDDDDTFWRDSPPASPVVSPFISAAPAVDPMDFHSTYFATTELFNPNPSVRSKLNPAAPAFEYQLSHACIPDATSETEQQPIQLQHPIAELSASEFLAESSSAAVPQPHTPQQRP